MASDRADIRRPINEALADLSLDEIRTVTQQLLTNAAPPIQDLLAAAKPQSRRRPRRKRSVTLRVRVDLSETKPKVWRRLELASDLMLDEVHQIVQAAFGWTDSHLHQFGSGPSYHSPHTENYLCPFMVDEGEEGVPEDRVRLDELLVEVNDKLFYTYDFGDNWRHVIRLEAVLARDQSAPRAVCIGGRGPAPAEDCGGAGGYALLVAATHPHHPDHAAARAEYAEIFGADVDPRGWAPTPFDIEQVNRELAGGDGTVTFRRSMCRPRLPNSGSMPIGSTSVTARTSPIRCGSCVSQRNASGCCASIGGGCWRPLAAGRCATIRSGCGGVSPSGHRERLGGPTGRAAVRRSRPKESLDQGRAVVGAAANRVP